MATYYCDSSMLVKRHISEPGSQWFRELVARQDTALFTSQISLVEVCSALNRRLREKYVNGDEYNSLMAQCKFLFGSDYEVMGLSDQVIEQACAALERHPLRGFDALHLATALLVNARLVQLNESPLTFLATDQRLLTAAAAESLLTFDPSAAA